MVQYESAFFISNLEHNYPPFGYCILDEHWFGQEFGSCYNRGCYAAFLAEYPCLESWSSAAWTFFELELWSFPYISKQ